MVIFKTHYNNLAIILEVVVYLKKERKKVDICKKTSDIQFLFLHRGIG
jgi:hypothetical protein